MGRRPSPRSSDRARSVETDFPLLAISSLGRIALAFERACDRTSAQRLIRSGRRVSLAYGGWCRVRQLGARFRANHLLDYRLGTGTEPISY